jgi:hypothetical protein
LTAAARHQKRRPSSQARQPAVCACLSPAPRWSALPRDKTARSRVAAETSALHQRGHALNATMLPCAGGQHAYVLIYVDYAMIPCIHAVQIRDAWTAEPPRRRPLAQDSPHRHSCSHSPPGPGSTAGEGSREGGSTHSHPHSAAATLSQDRSLRPPHTPRHTAPPPSSFPGTSAVHLVVLPLPVEDVAGKLAAGPLVDACPRAAARLDFLRFLLITVFSLSLFLSFLLHASCLQ